MSRARLTPAGVAVIRSMILACSPMSREEDAVLQDELGCRPIDRSATRKVADWMTGARWPRSAPATTTASTPDACNSSAGEIGQLVRGDRRSTDGRDRRHYQVSTCATTSPIPAHRCWSRRPTTAPTLNALPSARIESHEDQRRRVVEERLASRTVTIPPGQRSGGPRPLPTPPRPGGATTPPTAMPSGSGTSKKHQGQPAPMAVKATRATEHPDVAPVRSEVFQ